MKERTYRRVLRALLLIGGAVTLAHIYYAVQAYQRCSIIQFIAKELW